MFFFQFASHNDKFCQLLIQLETNKKALCNTYKNRAEVLDGLGMSVPVKGSSTLFSIDASRNVLDLASKLTAAFSTVVGTLTCTQNCSKKIVQKKLKSVQLLDENVGPDLYDATDIFSLQKSGFCSTRKCDGSLTNMVTEIGNLLRLHLCK